MVNMVSLDVRLGGKFGEGRAVAPGDQALLQRDRDEEITDKGEETTHRDEEITDKGEETTHRGEDGLREILENIREYLSDTQRKILLL